MTSVRSRQPAHDAEELSLYFGQLAELQGAMVREFSAIRDVAWAIVTAFRSGHKLLLCGNGGSAADCQHFAAELVGLFDHDIHRRGLPAIALTTDTSFLTAYANDVGFEQVFSRQVEALGSSGDVLVAISTSGGSANVLQAVKAARNVGLTTVGLSGQAGTLRQLVDIAIVVPSTDTQHIQEILLPVEHVIASMIESSLTEMRSR